MNDFINTCLRTLPVMPREEAKIVLADLYETHFEVFNHRDPRKNPLASTLLHESEDVFSDSALADLILDYALDDVGDLWKMSLVEFLNLPKPMADLIRKVKPIALQKKAGLIDQITAGRDK